MRGTRYHTRRRRGRRFEIVALLVGLALVVSQAIGVIAASAGTGIGGASLGDATTDVTKAFDPSKSGGSGGALSGAKVEATADTTAAPKPIKASAGASLKVATGANISVDFVAAGPKTYNHSTGTGSGNLPWYDSRNISKTSGVVESLEGGDFKCGDLVVFFTKIVVDGGSGTRDATMNLAFTKEPTGQPGAGFDDIVLATLSPNDSNAGGGNKNLDGNESVSLTNENDNAHFQGKDFVTGDVVVTNLNAGDELVVKVVAHLGCLVGSSPTGNLQALVNDESSDNNDDTFNIGQQTVPFKKVEDIAQPGINVVKTADAGTVQAGDPIGFTITVSNDGNVALPSVALSDPLPDGPGIAWTIAGTSGDTSGLSCNIASGTLTCTASSLAAGSSFSVHVTSPTTGDSCGAYNNTATVTAGQLTDSSSDSVDVQGCRVNLTLDKSASTRSVNAGDGFTYTIEVANDGNATATNVHVTDSMPAGVSIDSATFTGGSKGPGTCDVSGQDIDCDLGSLAPGGSATVTIEVTTTERACPSVTNDASVSADNETGSTEDNADSVAVEVVCSVDLTLDKSASTRSVNAGDGFTYTIEVANDGNATATNVHVTDSMPAGVSIDSATFTGGSKGPGTCDVSGQDIDCDLGSLAPGGSATVTIEVTTTERACPSVTNDASVSADNETGSTEDNADSVAVEVFCPLGIQIVKGGPALAHVGDTVTYTLDVSLTDDVPLTDVTVTDPICASDPTLDSKEGGDQDEWLEPGETWHYSCTHVVTASDPDPLPNTATVTGTDDRGRDVSDTDDHVVDIIHPAIEIVKTANPTSIGPGETVTYTYKVTNTGDVTLYNVTVDDDKLGHICDIPQLEVGETQTCTKDFTAGQKDLGPIDNIGTAQGEDETGYPVRDDDVASIDVVLGTTVTPPPSKTPPGGTAFTGSNDILPLAGAALVLLVIGSGLLYLGRRREGGSRA